MAKLVLEPGRTEAHYWKDLWRYRELFFFLSWRDILVRYKQTVIGVAWSVLRPLLTMIVFTVVFGKLGKFPAPAGVPYPVLVFAALLPWQFFANALSESSNSLVSNGNMLSKVYFPRIIVPSSAVMVAVVDFLISFCLLVVLMIGYQIEPSWRLLVLPVFFAQALLLALGVGYGLSSLTVKYRDFRFIVPFLVQFGLYISPVGFSSMAVPEKWRILYSLNPLVGVIEGFRWAIVGTANPFNLTYFLSLAVTALTLTVGIWYFRKTERFFADVI